ncbi:uncharacterized protein, partial [Halyomorpha halys]|uniref:uncharacterized protein n=1 Tax=Halyomorpha halys TaxID=286706 RepID=UPI000D0C8D80
MSSMPLCLSNRLYQALPSDRGQEKIVGIVSDNAKKKISEAVEYTSMASIYSPEEAVSELNTAQTSVLTLFYGLLFGDLPLCESIIQAQVTQLKSTYLRVWLADDFSFSQHDVSKVLFMLSFLLDTQKVLIPNYILRIFGGLVHKYSVTDSCSSELLDVFNEGQVKKCGDLQDVKSNSSAQSRSNDPLNIERGMNGLRNSFRRLGNTNLMKWFEK